MKRFSHSFVVPADIDTVWAFYADIGHLKVITPPEMHLKVVRTTSGTRLQEGTEVWLQGKLGIKSAWHSRITEMKPYIYVDEMLEGGFRVWKHTHAFERADSGTRVIDEIEFELRYGPLGRMLEGFAYRHLERIFAHRKVATIAALR